MRHTILVVEDEPVVREVIEAALVLHGYDVVVTASGAQALRELETGSIDAIVVDLLMPGMSGLEFLARMAADHGTIPVLVITGGEQSLIDGALRLGASASLMKPFQVATLTHAVAELLPTDAAAEPRVPLTVQKPAADGVRAS